MVYRSLQILLILNTVGNLYLHHIFVVPFRVDIYLSLVGYLPFGGESKKR